MRQKPYPAFVLGLAILLADGRAGPHTTGVDRESALSGSTAFLASPAAQVPRYQNAHTLALPANGRTGLHTFYFTRAVYTGYRGWRGMQSWSVDFPKADRQFLIGLRRLTNIDAYHLENPIALDDPALRRHPFIYALEVGYMSLTPPEVLGLREYLMSGGFLFVDDFWGTEEWWNFEREIRRVVPDHPIVDIPLDHPIFNAFYSIDSIIQVPNVGNGRQGWRTWERDGYVPHVRGIFDDTGRLMVAINWNTDLGDAWEWADDPFYPLQFSTFAWEVGINFIIYAMSH